MSIESPFVFDLVKSLRDDPARRQEVVTLMRRIDSLNTELREGKSSVTELQQAMADLIPASGFNFGLLIPQYFPTYPEDAPLDLTDRPFMFSMTSLAPGSIITLKAGRQVGKCAARDTLLRTRRHGHITMGQLFDMGTPFTTPRR
jgi:hypothetical protein